MHASPLDGHSTRLHCLAQRTQPGSSGLLSQVRSGRWDTERDVTSAPQGRHIVILRHWHGIYLAGDQGQTPCL